MDPALIEEAARASGLILDADKVSRLQAYIDYLKEVNRHTNLTAIRDDRGIARGHLQDSWQVLPHMPEGARVIDVGSGAGFPGLPLAIVRPDLEMTLLDARKKKVNFLSEVIHRLGLEGVRAVQGRAEELARRAPFRDGFDLAIARAVSALPELAELCLPLVRQGGLFIAMKGSRSEAEEAMGAIRLLKGELEDVLTYQLEDLDQPRHLVLIRKKGPSPPAYPRRMALIQKSPLS